MKNSALVAVFLFSGFVQWAMADCPACPTGGVWSAWNRTTTCTATCGMNGQLLQRRTCLSYSWGCPCTGPYSRAYTCPNNPCGVAPQCANPYTVQSSNSKCGPIPADPTPSNVTCSETADICWCPPSGVWSAWVNNGTCSATCGICGTIPQYRTCLSEDWGCNCTGNAARVKTCPNVLCTTGAECCNGKSAVTNLQTNTEICGVVIPDDPVYSQPCQCATCNAGTMTKVVASPYSPFTITTVNKNGCYRYIAKCTSITGHPANIEFNDGDNGVKAGTPGIQVSIDCASDGSGWHDLTLTTALANESSAIVN
ncbi:unnamed protein product, partial [Mesorhabditis belari]|uniref:Uncharacterized protein n=1 Tax=Mesorhabditis belari TaxID=2138241 RepID=A0AAF3F110_9BILA